MIFSKVIKILRAKNETEHFESLNKIEIEWWDAQTFYGKFTPHEIDDLQPAVGKAIGYLLKETDDYYIITPMVFVDRQCFSDECDDVDFIPKSGVISVNILEVKDVGQPLQPK